MRRTISTTGALIGALGAIALPGAAAAAGWTQPEGGHYVKVWSRLLRGEKAFLSDGTVAPLGGQFTDLAVGVYFEYGLQDGTTIIAQGTPFGWAQFTSDDGVVDGEVEGDTSYIGPISFGVRRALYRGEALVLSAELQIGYGPSLGEETIGAGTISAEDCEQSEPCRFSYRPAVEHARILGELQVGVPLPSGFWISAAAGGGSMLGITRVLKGLFQVGWASKFGLVVDFHSTAHIPFDDPGNDVAGAGVTRYVGIGPGISYWFSDHWGINVGAEGVLMAEANLATPTLSLGIEHK